MLKNENENDNITERTNGVLVECAGEVIEDFYAMEEKEGGYNPFWDMQEEK